jgi:hypothetical protein
MANMTWSIRLPARRGDWFVGLRDVLADVPDNTWDWRLWDLYGIGHAPDNMAMPEFERAVCEAPRGYSLSWTDLLYFAVGMDQIYDCLLTAVRPGDELTAEEALNENSRKLLVMISAEDSAYWKLSSNLSGKEGESLHSAWQSLAAHPSDAWQAALTASDSLLVDAAAARRHRTSALAVIKSALRSATGRARALTLLTNLGSDFISEVVRELVEVALSHGYALSARELLGQLSFDEAARAVPPAVSAQLAETDDDDAYRRMAELLSHLGLASALQDLCRHAAASEDADVREVAEDFAP